MKTLRRRFKRRKTKRFYVTKLHHISAGKKRKIVNHFLDMLTAVKLHHWNTGSYAQHKATDELYERLNEHIDKFVEVLLGKDEARISLLEKKIHVPENNDNFNRRIHEFLHFLTEMHLYLDPVHDTDLLNIRDEIAGDINQFIFLSRMK